ncbi:MAG: type II toxin-antitoxin system VapC family toxin [Chloroflexota bacterium]|nr:type II toxin-antitoxin system VapC family toxin [Chloroflexota bacterium]
MIFLDANVFLRALTRSSDPNTERMRRIADNLFRRVGRGDIDVTTSDAVIAEVAFILTAKSHYHLAVDDAAERLAALLRLQGVRLRPKHVILRALDLWAERPTLEFVDALTASYAQQAGIELATFDTDFDELPGITRWQPEEGDPNGRRF